MPCFTSYVQLNTTYEFSWFYRNSSSTIEDMKNLSTKMNYTGLITPLTKSQLSSMKDERKRLFLVNSYSIVKYETLVPNILSHSLATVISELVLNTKNLRSSRI